MGTVIQFVATYAPWIYAVCGLVALYQIYKLWAVRAERKQAVFSLEREKAIQDTYSTFAVAMILLLAMGLTYFTSTTLAAAVEPIIQEALAPQPVLPFVPTPTNTPLPATATPDVTPTPPPADDEDGNGVNTPPVEAVAIVREIEELPTPTPQPVAPLVQAPACADTRALLLRPGNNEVVQGTINVIGTATHENFQYYKIEYAPGVNASGGFNYLAGGSAPVVNNYLGSVNTSTLNNGQWTLRLVVVDMSGNFPDPCQVTITVDN
jgi:hypothetical protein